VTGEESGTNRLRAGIADNLAVWAAYLVSFGVALFVWVLLGDRSPIVAVFWADVAGTIAIFLFSLAFDNSSFYDPYWSVAPIAIALCWALATPNELVNSSRQLLVIALVTIWGVRLSYNWWRGWRGISHEDWRYMDFREKCGVFYWPVSFAGIHMYPTLAVFLGCLPIYPALALSSRPLGWLDAVAAVVTVLAIAIETAADRQLHRFRSGSPEPGEVLQSGLWARSRHPNYLGEILFWWGLYLFGLAADVTWWWTVAGALVITIMFRFVSLRMIETRMLERRPAFGELQTRIPILLPRIF